MALNNQVKAQVAQRSKADAVNDKRKRIAAPTTLVSDRLNTKNGAGFGRTVKENVENARLSDSYARVAPQGAITGRTSERPKMEYERTYRTSRSSGMSRPTNMVHYPSTTTNKGLNDAELLNKMKNKLYKK